MSDSTDLRRLFADYANGDIAAEPLQVLETALREDADLRREFIEYMNIDSALGDLAALPETEFTQFADELTSIANANDLCPHAGQAEEGQRPFSIKLVAIVVTVAASLLMATTLWITGQHAVKDTPLATLVTQVDAALVHNGEPWKEAELPKGEYHLNRGLLHLQFAGKVKVYIEAPARFDIVSEERLELLTGRVSATVPREGIGFTVETSEATIVDYGTEFSVEAESGASEVHVFVGLVRVHSRRGRNDEMDAIDLSTSEAVRIEDSPQGPVPIKLATERFIRTFEEPQRNYAHSVKQLSPVAYYRMPIRDRGLVSIPPQYSGKVLTGDGIRPPHAHGVFAGGSLRVGADSTGCGGRVDCPPPLNSGQFTLAVFVYLKTPAPDGTVVTNMCGDKGSFALTLDESNRLQATVRGGHGEVQSVTSDIPLMLTTWRHVVVTADADQLKMYEDGRLVASAPCGVVATGESETMWLGTDADGHGLWSGRIDELALFDRALSVKNIADLYQAAREERARAE